MRGTMYVGESWGRVQSVKGFRFKISVESDVCRERLLEAGKRTKDSVIDTYIWGFYN